MITPPKLAPGVHSAPAPASLDQLRALVVADGDLLRGHLQKLLRRAKLVQVDGVSSAEALAHIATNQADVVISAWRMDAVHGPDLTRHLRAGGDTAARQRLIFLVPDRHDQRGEARVQREALEAGANGVLTQPVTLHHVISEVGAAAANPRLFVRTLGYSGPDRRRMTAPADMTPGRRRCDVEGLTPAEEAALNGLSRQSLLGLLDRLDALDALDLRELEALAAQAATARGDAAALGDQALAEALKALGQQVRRRMEGAVIDPRIKSVYRDALRLLVNAHDGEAAQRRQIVAELTRLNRSFAERDAGERRD